VTSNNENEALPHEEIACRAYEIYQERGSEPGRDLDDWLRAERELRTRLAIADETTERTENTISQLAGENS
jgi:hypothetical protein